MSALDSTHDHTEELVGALERSVHLLTRPSLKRLVARILHEPEGLGDEFEAAMEVAEEASLAPGGGAPPGGEAP